MKSTGLCAYIIHLFIDVSTKNTFFIYTFVSAALINIFIPSGGGQWAVQGPMIMKAALMFELDVAKTGVVFAWGDAWTNLIQPFWAIPLLSIVNLKIKDILGYCFLIFLFTGIIIFIILSIF
jgi:short-chain fatty acids transporter